MKILDKIKNLFSKKAPNEEEVESSQDIQLLKDVLYRNLPKWEDLGVVECLFKKTNKKRILIVDDYGAITTLVKKDLLAIFRKDFKKQLEHKTIQMIEDVQLSEEDVDVCIVSNELAPYIIQKTCSEGKCFFDYAIIDILFGDFIIKDNHKLYLDGIDIVKTLKKNNPNVKTVLFTGCYLDNFYNSERKKIKEKLGQEYLENKILIKTESIDKRIQFFIKNLFKD